MFDFYKRSIDQTTTRQNCNNTDDCANNIVLEQLMVYKEWLSFKELLQYFVFVYINKMCETDEFMRVLKNWRNQESHTVICVLQRINAVKILKGEQLNLISNSLSEFHREISRAKEGEVEPKWYQHCINLKKKVKKWQDTQEREKREKPLLQKRPSQNIDYPESLTSFRGPRETHLLKYLYRSFITNFDQGANAPETISFIQNLLKLVKEIFEDKAEELMTKRINSICLRLGRQGSRQSKGRMMKGQIPCYEVARDNEQVYMDQKAKESIRLIQLAQLEESRTGFYDEMKRNINKDACEECRFCRKLKAFCEDQKQIRASDEPMTRFMRCNQCGKAWRD